MSASKKKKDRQGDLPLTEKQRKAQQEAATAHRNKILYTIIGIVVSVAVVALLVWDSGIMQRGSTALTIHDRNYTPAEVSYYYGMARNQYSYYLSMMGYDSSKPDRDQIFDESNNQSYFDLFLGDAKKLMVQTAALADAARADGMTLTEEGRTSVDTAMASYESQATQYGYTMDSYLKANFGKYMTKDVLRACLEESRLASQYYTAHSDSLNFDDAAVKAYYEENSASLDSFVYDVCFVNGTPKAETDAEGKTVEPTDEQKKAAMEAAKQAADDLAAAVKAGEDFEKQASLTTNKIASSTLTMDSNTLGSQLSTVYREWMTDAGRRAGDITVIEAEGSGYYVLRFGQRFLDEKSFGTADIRHILVKAEVAEGADAPTDEAMTAAKEKAQAILDQFKAGEQTSDAFAALAKENSDDPGSKDNGGLYENISRSTSFFPAFLNWIFENGRQAGDTGLVENTQSGQQGWHVMYLDKVHEPLWVYTATNALRSAEMQSWSEALEKGYEVVEGSGLSNVG